MGGWTPAVAGLGSQGLASGSRPDKPRSRIFDVGPGAMGDAELVALLVGAGGPTTTAQHTAEELLQRFDGVAGLARAHVTDLRNEHGVGVARAAVIAAAIELGRRSLGPRAERPRLRYATDVYAHYRPKLAHLRNEVFHVACLDTRNRLLRDVRVAEGGLISCATSPREVFAAALREGATGVVLVHNHPSGETQPSAEDLALTQRMRRAGEVMGIGVLDHVIVGTSGFTSLAATGQLTCEP